MEARKQEIGVIDMNMSTKKKQISVISAVAEGALILATVLVSWCALALGTNPAQAQSPPPYPIGVWGPF